MSKDVLNNSEVIALENCGIKEIAQRTNKVLSEIIEMGDFG